MITSSTPEWRKARRSGGGNNNCVEIRRDGLVRDSKNASGPTVQVDLMAFLTAVKAGLFDQR